MLSAGDLTVLLAVSFVAGCMVGELVALWLYARRP